MVTAPPHSTEGADMAKTEIQFVYDDHETSGTYRFRELRANGQPVSNPRDGKIGALYVRKGVFNGGRCPQKLTVTLEYEPTT
jgi:hypothetical protein